MTAVAEDKVEKLFFERKAAQKKLEEIQAELEKELLKTMKGKNGQAQRPPAAAAPASVRQEATRKTTKKPTARRQEGQDTTLKDVIRTVLGRGPAQLKEVVAAAIDEGYKSDAKDFSPVVYQNLRTMMKNGEVDKDQDRQYFLV
jgi:hypothetical protein